jgi:DNA-binding winged helix-turn-helix (wHTH) protein
MAEGWPKGVVRHRRKWTFSSCVFDEANWTLTVDGRRIPVEAKPLELLRELLLNAGTVVSKQELLDRVWPGVTVVEASLATAVSKLRTALRDERRKKPVIETVPRIGYRIAVPVACEDADMAAVTVDVGSSRLGAEERTPASSNRSRRMARNLGLAGAAIAALLLTSLSIGPSRQARVKPRTTYTQAEVSNALRKLDIAAIERMLAAGWDPSEPWDKEGNDALGVLLNRCEWEPAHDRRKMLLMARTLIEGGAPIDRRNVWGDTAYSIAKADRYCGPDHPVTQMLEAMCYGGAMGPKDLCLATYELTAEQRRAQGLPPKS